MDDLVTSPEHSLASGRDMADDEELGIGHAMRASCRRGVAAQCPRAPRCHGRLALMVG
jgi:hypothetical protein